MTMYAIVDTRAHSGAIPERLGVFRSKPIARAKLTLRMHMWMIENGFSESVSDAEKYFSDRYIIEPVEIEEGF